MTAHTPKTESPSAERLDASQDFAYARLLLRVNPLVRLLLRSPLHGVLSGRLMLVDFRGRRSGRSFSIPVAYTEVGDDLIVLVSKAATRSWWRNFREPWPATLTLRRKQRDMQGTSLEPGSQAFRKCFEETFRRWNDTARIYDIEYDAERGLSESQLATLSQQRGAVRFTPAGGKTDAA
ncbi:MAG: hypothetical protein JRG92_04555 [Deltaproteobacteria bacterium]|nr:hypothetical protein [Deltaproteobacteria bacterium]MBW2697110.1 hypothetical protein [Deltaproteobacteria bacterium]